MPLIPKRSIWDWAQKIAATSDEAFELALEEILVAVKRRELHATTADDRKGTWRKLLPAMIFAARVQHTIPPKLRQERGILTLTHRIMIEASAIEAWLRSRGVVM